MSRKNTPALAGVSILTKTKAPDAGADASRSAAAQTPTEKAAGVPATPAGATEDPSVRITLRLPDSQWRALKLLALDERSNVTALITEAVAGYLRSRKPG